MTNEKKALITVLTDNSLAQFRPQLIRILLSDVEKHETQMQIPHNKSQMQIQQNNRKGYVYLMYNTASKVSRIGMSYSLKGRIGDHLGSNDSGELIHSIETNTPRELEITLQKMFKHRNLRDSFYRLTNMEIHLIKKYGRDVEKIAEELNAVKYDNCLSVSGLLRFLSVSRGGSRRSPVGAVFSRFLKESFDGQCDFCAEELVLRLQKWDGLSHSTRKADVKQLIHKVRWRFLLIDESQPIFRAVNKNCRIKYELINGRLYKAMS